MSTHNGETDDLFGPIAGEVVELGNAFAEEHPDADLWEIGSGLLAGAVQFWLFSRQPCRDPFCQACADLSSPDHRLAALLSETRNLAEESDYYSSANDVTTGTA